MEIVGLSMLVLPVVVIVGLLLWSIVEHEGWKTSAKVFAGIVMACIWYGAAAMLLGAS